MILSQYINFIVRLLGAGGSTQEAENLKEDPYGNGGIQQIPMPHKYWTPIIYPEDYCKNITDEEEFDYIVIGAGPAGVPVARRLAEDRDVKVLILEAGEDPLESSDIPIQRSATAKEEWNITTESTDHQCMGYVNNACPYMYAKFLGGTSVVNLMMYSRGNHKDYDEWEEKGGKGWGWKDMFPYFLKLENLQDPRGQFKGDMAWHNVGGPMTTTPSQIDPQSYEFRQRFFDSLSNQKVKYNPDVNGENQIGYGDILVMQQENGYRNNVAKAYLLHIPHNLKVCKNSIVHNLSITSGEDGLKKVTHVNFEYTGSGESVMRKVKPKIEVLLAAGAISTPQILERSGVGQKKVIEAAGVELVHELEGVGENIQEHFTNIGCGFTLQPHTQTPRMPVSNGFTGSTLFLNMTDFNNPIPDLQWLFLPYSPQYMRFKEEITKQYQAVDDNLRIFFAGSCILHQTNRGYVHIRSKNPHDSPSFDPMQFTSQYETDITVKGCRLIRKTLQDPLVAKFKPTPLLLNECKKYEYNSEEEIMCHARLVAFPTHHLAGTSTMGPKTDKKAVVDINLKVHGFSNLRVTDTGVMPHTTRGNTEIPGLAISEKAADIIKRENHKIKGSKFWWLW